MLTREENELLTRVERGTPAGELLRRYWQAVGVAGELTDEKPIKAVKVLGEELVLYRDKKSITVSLASTARIGRRRLPLAAWTRRESAARITAGNLIIAEDVSSNLPSRRGALSKIASNTRPIR